MAYVVCAKWTAKEGEEEAVAAAVANIVGPSRAEPGIVQYQPHRDPENPRVFFFYEQYVDADAYQAHVDSEHMQRWGFGDAIPRLESRVREFYETWEVR
jgi:quinol monooxygenase YgiN